jgi:hypothetical protein
MHFYLVQLLRDEIIEMLRNVVWKFQNEEQPNNICIFVVLNHNRIICRCSRYFHIRVHLFAMFFHLMQDYNISILSRRRMKIESAVLFAATRSMIQKYINNKKRDGINFFISFCYFHTQFLARSLWGLDN